MNVLRWIVRGGALLWIFIWVSSIQDEDFAEPSMLIVPIGVLVVWLVYCALLPFMQGYTGWIETACAGVVLMPFVIVIGAAITFAALIYGGLRYGRTYLGQRRAG